MKMFKENFSRMGIGVDRAASSFKHGILGINGRCVVHLVIFCCGVGGCIWGGRGGLIVVN
jgi:hypothetical protein